MSLYDELDWLELRARQKFCEANRAKPTKTVMVSFPMKVPADATDEEIAEYLKYELFGGMLRGDHPLIGIPVRTDDPSTVEFHEQK